jgi:hypothetical protein
LVIGTSTGALKAFRIALVATGVGAIVVGLGLLVANFDKVKKAVMNLIPGLGAVADFFGNLIEAVTDFIGITSDATRALDKMVEDSEASLKRSEHFLEANGDKYDEYTQRKIKANIDYNKKVKELAEDEVLTEEEKLKRIADFRAKANREIEKADADRAEKNRKTREEEANKIAEENRRAYEKRQQELKEQQQRDFEIAMAGAEAGRKFDEEQRAIFEENRKLQEEEDEELLNKSIEKLVEETRAKQEEADNQIMIDEMVRDAKISIADNTLNLINEIAGRGSKIGKAIAVAQATISGIQGAQNAFTTASLSPITTAFPAYPFVQAGLAGAFSLLQIKKILSTDASGKSSPSPTNTGGGAGGGQQAPSFNIVGGTGSNQIAQSLAGQQQPLQAFVVGSAVTTQQSLDRNIVDGASL